MKSLSPIASLCRRTTGKAPSGLFATPGAGRQRICTPHGSRSCSTLHSMRHALGSFTLHEVMRHRSRNLLFNHLGLREDQSGSVMRPDCADLPYFLPRLISPSRWGCLLGYSKCSRGGGGQPPRCARAGGTSSIRNLLRLHRLTETRLSPIREGREAPCFQCSASQCVLDRLRLHSPAERPCRLIWGLRGIGHYLLPNPRDAVHSGSGEPQPTMTAPIIIIPSRSARRRYGQAPFTPILTGTF